MTKRRKFLFSSFLLSLGLLATQYVPVEFKYIAVFGFFLISYMVSAWALIDDLKGAEWITIVSMPALYATSVSLFYFLLPQGFGARISILTLFGLGMYASYLTSNIFSVAAIRTIQLLRAAHAVGFLITLITMVLFYNTIFSLRLPFYWNGLLSGIVSFPLLLSALWSVKLEEGISKKILWYSAIVSIIMAQIGIVLSFIPVSVWVASLFLVTISYVTLGVLQHELFERLFEKTLQEYITVGIFVLIAMMIVTRWK